MKKNGIVLIIICLAIIILLIACINIRNKTVQVSSTVASLSNKKIGWGIKREPDHKQPNLGAENKSLIDKYNGIAMGNNEEKVVYITFDNGYEAGYTEKILDVLKDNDVKASFFITGHYLNSATDLVKRMIAEGHIIGNHTVNHYSMPDINDEKLNQEVMNFHQAMYDKLGYEMKYIRPPKGEYSERTLSMCKSLGYTTVMWSLAYDDWEEAKQGREEYGKSKVLDNIHPGAVILLHGTSKDNSEILDYCIKEIKNMGYEIRNIDQFAI